MAKSDSLHAWNTKVQRQTKPEEAASHFVAWKVRRPTSQHDSTRVATCNATTSSQPPTHAHTPLLLQGAFHENEKPALYDLQNQTAAATPTNLVQSLESQCDKAQIQSTKNSIKAGKSAKASKKTPTSSKPLNK